MKPCVAVINHTKMIRNGNLGEAEVSECGGTQFYRSTYPGGPTILLLPELLISGRKWLTSQTKLCNSLSTQAYFLESCQASI